MSRFTGPRLKIMRALGTELPGLSRKTIENRPNPPGQHGGRMRRKKSDFGVKLMEKQKLRFNYGLTETQLRRLMIDARRGNAPTGETLLQLLERRLDNVVFRAGFAPTIAAARQLVNHGHFLLNDKPVDIPSIRVRINDVVAIKSKSKNIPLVTETLKDIPLTRPEWLAWDDQESIVRVSHMPSPEDVPFPVDVQQVVEYYANRL
jgi:small subunit ribosomal protein S4